MSRKKTLLIVGGGLILVAVAVVLAVLLISGGDVATGDVQIGKDSDAPVIVYQKKVGQDDAHQKYDAYLCRMDESPQNIANGTIGVEASDNGKVIMVEAVDDSVLEKDIYLVFSNGEEKLCATNVRNARFARNGYMLCLLQNEDQKKLHIQYYSDVGQLLNEREIITYDDNFSWSANAQADLILIEKEDGGDKGPNLYLHSDNKLIKIATQGRLSIDGQNISDNGTLIYIADVNEETKVGTLFIKEMGEEAVVITQNAKKSHTISSDGRLVAAEVADDGLFYQYIGNEAHIVDNVKQYCIGKDNQTLIYSVETGEQWHYDLYWVKNDLAPVQIAQNMSVLLEVSDDGSYVAYLANVNEQTGLGDLYLVGEEKDPELIDSDVSMSAWTSFFMSTLVTLNHDGTAVAYLKNYDENYLRGDLFIKRDGEVPVMIDKDVGVNFYFFGD